MNNGKLFEISSLGTGFIEYADGRVCGFHHSMLATVMSREQWPLLEGKPVAFDLVDGVARQVRIAPTENQALAAAQRSR
jgi:hypothetical protein